MRKQHNQDENEDFSLRQGQDDIVAKRNQEKWRRRLEGMKAGRITILKEYLQLGDGCIDFYILNEKCSSLHIHFISISMHIHFIYHYCCFHCLCIYVHAAVICILSLMYWTIVIYSMKIITITLPVGHLSLANWLMPVSTTAILWMLLLFQLLPSWYHPSSLKCSINLCFPPPLVCCWLWLLHKYHASRLALTAHMYTVHY